MNRVLIVSPHFPPLNGADMQRVRMSLPYFRECGWEPSVLSVAPGAGDVIEPLLSESVPPDTLVERVPSIPLSLTRLLGVSDRALRALPFLYSAGSRLLAARNFDLVYFSTTLFLAMPLGRLWKRKFGTPYVLDIQDPWLSDYYEKNLTAERPPKYRIARGAHGVLEPWTMKKTDGIIAVSADYIETLRRRYPWLQDTPCATLPFGASAADFTLLDRHPQANRHFAPGDGRAHGVYAGRGGSDLSTALDILFGALRSGLELRPDVFDRVKLHFVGTDYAKDGRAKKTITPAAERAGLTARVSEDTTRLPYFEALQLLKDSNFLLVVGSDDPAYTASKIYPYILARKPLLAIVHERSPLVAVLRETRAATTVVTFSSACDDAEKTAAAACLTASWGAMLEAAPRAPDTDWARFERYTAREMTRRQCELFDRVLARRSAAAA